MAALAHIPYNFVIIGSFFSDISCKNLYCIFQLIFMNKNLQFLQQSTATLFSINSCCQIKVKLFVQTFANVYAAVTIFYLDSGSGTVGRVVADYIIDPGFEFRHPQFQFIHCCIEKMKIKKKRPGRPNFLKTTFYLRVVMTRVSIYDHKAFMR